MTRSSRCYHGKVHRFSESRDLSTSPIQEEDPSGNNDRAESRLQSLVRELKYLYRSQEEQMREKKILLAEGYGVVGAR